MLSREHHSLWCFLLDVAEQPRSASHNMKYADGGGDGMQECRRAIEIWTVNMTEDRHEMAALLWIEHPRRVKVKDKKDTRGLCAAKRVHSMCRDRVPLNAKYLLRHNHYPGRAYLPSTNSLWHVQEVGSAPRCSHDVLISKSRAANTDAVSLPRPVTRPRACCEGHLI